MSNTKRSRRSRAIGIALTDIKCDTTCVNIFPGELPLSITGEVCGTKLDINTKKSSRKSKKERYMHYLNRYKQYWSIKWSSQNLGKFTKHSFTIRYLNITQDVTIEFEEF